MTNKQTHDETAAIRMLKSYLEQAERIVVFTGAGISTESGIPDYRSAGTGLWNKIKPIPFDDFIGSAAVRKQSWARRFDGERMMDGALPNRGHRAVAQLVDDGRCHAVITQNVDGLHQASGIAAEHVIELHGNATYARCLSCGQRYEMDDLEAEYRSLGDVQPCSACGGIIKSATISFGQAMPEHEMRRAEQAVNEADLCLTLGSSLAVYPAAGFPQLAVQRGATLVIVNREPTPLDEYAHLALHEQIGDVLGAAVGVN